MKYIRGVSDSTIEELPKCKLRLTDGDEFTETPWGARLPDGEGIVLLNHALAFTPWPSWGAIMPSTSFNFLEMHGKQELTLHPEAFDYYLKEKWIAEDGEGLEQLR